MIRNLLISTFLLAAGGAAAWALFFRDDESDRPIREPIGGIVWARRIDLAGEQARPSGKPLLVVFRCPP